MKVRTFQNLQFYQDSTKRISDKNYISPKIFQHIEKWKIYNSIPEFDQFFKDLEQDHNYIQWLFPNFFTSMFNSNSYRLEFEELSSMRDDKDIMNQLIQNLEMMKLFFGLKSEPIEFLELFDKQFDKCFNKNLHNRLRIKRILCCLRVFSLDDEADEILYIIKKKGEKFEYLMKYYDANFQVFSQKVVCENIEYYLQKDLLDERNQVHLLNIINQKQQKKKRNDKTESNKQQNQLSQQNSSEKQSKVDEYKQKSQEIKKLLNFQSINENKNKKLNDQEGRKE